MPFMHVETYAFFEILKNHFKVYDYVQCQYILSSVGKCFYFTDTKSFKCLKIQKFYITT